MPDVETISAAPVGLRQVDSAPSPRALYWAPLIAALFFALNIPVVNDWRVYSFDDGTYSHAYLIPLMSAYVLYAGWRAGALRLRWSWGFAGLLALSLVLYQWMELGHQRFVARALVPLCLALALLTVYRGSRYVVGAGALFWFVAPVWGPVNEFLQWTSVSAVATIMSFTGIPTFVYSEYVQIPAGTFEIADGCSGLRYVIATLALVFFYCILYMRRYPAMLIFGFAALLGAMLTNWLRIVALIFIGHFTNMQSPLIADHNMFGWFLFFPLMFLIFRFADRLESDRSVVSGEGRQPAQSGANPPVPGYLPLLGVALILAALSGSSVRLLVGAPPFPWGGELDVTTAQPIALDDSGDPAPVLYAPGVVTRDALAAGRGYVYRVAFDGHNDAARAEFYLNAVQPQGWRVLSSDAQGQVGELHLEKDGQQARVQYAYGVGGSWTASKAALRALRLRAALSLERRSELVWGIVYCAAHCSDDERREFAGRVPPVSEPPGI